MSFPRFFLCRFLPRFDPQRCVRFAMIFNLSVFAVLGILFSGNGIQLDSVVQARSQAGSLAVVSAASFSGSALAPEAIASAFGEGLATTTAVAQDQDVNTPGMQLPTTLGRTTLKVREIAAQLLFVSPQQINFVIPTQTLPSTDPQDLAAVEVTAGNGTVTTGQMQVADVAPAVFTFDGRGSGLPAAYLVRVKPDQQQVIEPLTVRDAVTGAVTARSIDLGAEAERVFLILYVSGIRRAPDANGDGNLNETVRVWLNGFETIPAYVSRHSEFAGVEQINCEIPRSFLGNQKLTVRVTAGGTNNGPAALAASSAGSNLTEIQLAIPPVTEVQWQALGLENQDVHALASSGETLVLGTSTGIYRTVDDGVNFLPARNVLPYPLTYRTLAFSVVGGRTCLAGTDGHGILNSSNDGDTWISFEADLALQREKILSFASGTDSAGQNSYAGTDGKGVFRRTPQRWQPIGLNEQKITALAINSNKLFAATATAGLQATTDKGATWQAAGQGLPAGAIINALVVNGGNLYAGTSSGLWRSTDNGGSWTELKLGLTQNFSVQAILVDESNIFAGTAGSGIVVSNDAGKTWKSVNEGLTTLDVLSLSYYAGRLYAGTRGGGVFATAIAAGSNLPPVAESQTVTLDEDTQASFKLIGSDPNGDPIKFRLLSQPRTGYFTGEAPNLTYVPYPNYNGSDSVTFIVQDGKTSSRLATVTLKIRPVDDPPTLNTHAPATSIVGGLVIVEASASDPDREPVTVTATSLPTGATLLATPAEDQRAIVKLLPMAAGTYKFSFAASQGGPALLTREVSVIVTESQPSNDWAQMPLFFDKRVNQLLPIVEPDGSTTLYLVAEEVERYRFAGLYRSVNTLTWARVDTNLPADLIGMPRLSEGGGKFYLDTSDGVFRSTDKGVSFANVTAGKGLPGDGKQFEIKAKDDQLLAWTANQLFRSVDAGESWAEITNNLPVATPQMDGGRMKDAAVSGNVLLASLSYGIQDNGARTYRSLDNGVTWQYVNADDAVSLYFFPDGDTVYGLTAMFLHRSDDNGASWPTLNPLFNSTRPNGVVPNTFVAARDGVVVLLYSSGQLYRSADKGETWTEISGAPSGGLVISPQWLYVVTGDGIYIRPNH